jgi:hypothetical protein
MGSRSHIQEERTITYPGGRNNRVFVKNPEKITAGQVDNMEAIGIKTIEFLDIPARCLGNAQYSVCPDDTAFFQFSELFTARPIKETRVSFVDHICYRDHLKPLP